MINLAAVAVKQNDFARAHELLARAKDMPLVEAQAYELMAVLESKENGPRQYQAHAPGRSQRPAKLGDRKALREIAR